MSVAEAHDSITWNSFLKAQPFRPFLQSWTMGEVYRDVGQEPIRLIVEENGEIQAICQAFVVPARRGRHLSIPYGPVINSKYQAVSSKQVINTLIAELTTIAKQNKCSFIRLSPFWPLPATRYPMRSPPPFTSSPNTSGTYLSLLRIHGKQFSKKLITNN